MNAQDLTRRYAEFDHEIQVSGNRTFPEAGWRGAILYYLEGIWGEKDEVECRPKITFRDVTLQLNREAGEYFAYGRTSISIGDIMSVRSSACLMVEKRQAEVEQGLIRFVRSNRLEVLGIYLPKGMIALRKLPHRRYILGATGISKTWSGLGPA